MHRYQVFSLLTGEPKGAFQDLQQASQVVQAGDYTLDTEGGRWPYVYWYQDSLEMGIIGESFDYFSQMVQCRAHARLRGSSTGYFAHLAVESGGCIIIVKVPAMKTPKGWTVFWDGAWQTLGESASSNRVVQQINRFTSIGIFGILP